MFQMRKLLGIEDVDRVFGRKKMEKCCLSLSSLSRLIQNVFLMICMINKANQNNFTRQFVLMNLSRDKTKFLSFVGDE